MTTSKTEKFDPMFIGDTNSDSKYPAKPKNIARINKELSEGGGRRID